MTLGELIREYGDKNTIADFVRDSGFSKAYTYKLINNKNANGNPICPSYDAIKKAAKGMHMSLDELLTKLDQDIIENPAKEQLPKEIFIYYNQLPIEAKESVHEYIKQLYEENKTLIEDYQTMMNKKKITNLDDAKMLLKYSEMFGGIEEEQQIIELANIVKSSNHKI